MTHKMGFERRNVPDEAAMLALGKELVAYMEAGQVVLLEGPLGAGKTTLVRGVLQGIGYRGAVRSPTFNLIQIFPTDPPIMHADLYRVKSWRGTGIEDYLESHLCFIEWPERATGLLEPEACWQVGIVFHGSGRIVNIRPPGHASA